MMLICNEGGAMNQEKQAVVLTGDEIYMRHLIWVTAILFVMSALANSNNRLIQPVTLSEDGQVATCGVLTALAVWPKVKKTFGV